MLKARLYEFEIQKEKKKMKTSKVLNQILAGDIKLDHMCCILMISKR